MDQIIDLLDRNGLSKTKVRAQLLKVFIEAKKPLSILDFKDIPNFQGISESSIYRNLTRFEEAGIIHLVPSSNEYNSYEMVAKGEHHHHITCTQCKKVQCLSICKIERDLKKLATKVGFSLDTHALQLSGTCKECRKAKSGRLNN